MTPAARRTSAVLVTGPEGSEILGITEAVHRAALDAWPDRLPKCLASRLAAGERWALGGCTYTPTNQEPSC